MASNKCTKAINDREGRKKLFWPKKSTYGKDLPLDMSPIQLIYLFMGQFLQKSYFENMSFFQKFRISTLTNTHCYKESGGASVKALDLRTTGPGSIPSGSILYI